MGDEIRELLKDVKTHLKYQKDSGNDYIPCGKAETGRLVLDSPPGKGARSNSNKIDFERSPAPHGTGRSAAESRSQSTPKAKRQTSTGKSNQEKLDLLRKEIGDCKRCKLCKGRINLVFGAGSADAGLMFAGEGPGSEEDKQGLPFVGRAGKLLDKILEAMGMTRDDVYIGNVVKCRPPENRNPEEDEIKTCMPFLKRQIEIIKPKVIVCLGTFASQSLLNTTEKISRLRGKIHELDGTKVMPTYHPAFLLRNASMKRPVWEDMQIVMKELENS